MKRQMFVLALLCYVCVIIMASESEGQEVESIPRQINRDNAEFHHLRVEQSSHVPANIDYQVHIAVATKNQYPDFSPNGERIVFEAGSANQRHIWKADADGSHPKQLTHGKGNNYKPVWSPDGETIAFFSDRSGNFDIWLMNTDGGGLQQVTTHPTSDRYPTFSPDGERIAFSSWRNGGPHLYVMGVDGSNSQQVTFGKGKDFEPTWSPRGNPIAFFSIRNGTYAIWTVKADGTGLRQLTENWGEIYIGGWWPDGSKILAFSNHSGIFSINSDDGEVTVILSLQSDIWHPNVSNDGQSLLFETPASFLSDEKTPDEIVILKTKMPFAVKRKAVQQQFGYLIDKGYEIISGWQADTNHDSVPELLLGVQEAEFVDAPRKPARLLVFEKKGNQWVEVWSFEREDNYFGSISRTGLMDGLLNKSLRVMDINDDGKHDVFFMTSSYGGFSGGRSRLHLYSWDHQASTYLPLIPEDIITLGTWGSWLLADDLLIRDIEPQYKGKEIIVAKYVLDDDVDHFGRLKGWEISFYGWEAGRYILYRQTETLKTYENASMALRKEIGFKPLLK